MDTGYKIYAEVLRERLDKQLEERQFKAGLYYMKIEYRYSNQKHEL